MTDELDRLKQALDATRPDPDPGARDRAVDAAMRAFDAEFSRAAQGSLQGSAAPARPKVTRAGWLARLTGGLKMNIPMPRMRPALMGGASLAVIVIAVLAVRDMPRDDGGLSHFAAPTAEREVAAERSQVAGAAGQVGGTLAKKELDLANRLKTDTLSRDERKNPVQRRAAQTMSDVVAPAQEGRADSTTVLPQAAPPPQKGLIANAPALAIGSMQTPAEQPMPQVYQEQGRDQFAQIHANPVKVTAEEPVSTFSIDVDTASYSFVRRSILEGVLPQKDAVRIEEMVNYFPYDYPLPETRETPFRADVQIMPTPWNSATKLMRVGIKGYALAPAGKPRANLVFLIDSSGSMQSPDKLPLLVNSFKLLLESLSPDDTVAIVTYAGSAGTVLEPTKVKEAGKILTALEQLQAGGSTAGAEGIRQAYRLAEANFDKGGVNRVILATDGDFNVGITDIDELRGFVERERDSGIFLSVLGFGQGNLNDEMMQALAQNGNGQAAYIDTLSEARKTLVEEAGSTLFPIAKDVKIQVEFNPATVAEYRLIGYETRLLAREDFNNDKVDAGEIGSGHAVTALYEITPAGSAGRLVDDLRYGQAAAPAAPAEPAASGKDGEFGFVKIRYKAPDGDTSRLIETPVTAAAEMAPDAAAAQETRFAAAVAGFGQLLRGGEHMGGFSYDDVAALAQGAKGADPFGYRAEFVNLVRLAKSAAALEPLR